MDGSFHGLVTHGGSAMLAMGWGRLLFGALLVFGLTLLVRLTLFRTPR